MSRRRVSLGLAAAFAVLSVTGCSAVTAPIPSGSSSATPSVSLPAPLAGTSWRLVSIGDLWLLLGPDVTLAFSAGEISGDGGCNSFNGSYVLEPATGSLRIGALGATKRACVEAVRGDLESAYFAALRGAAAVRLDEAGRLVLSGASPTLVFEHPLGRG